MVHGHRFDEFWASVVRELDEVPLDVDIQRSSFYSEPEWDVFEVRYTGLGGYRLFAWMSVPRGQGPFPALVQMPSYGSAVDIPYTSLRREAVVLDASHRGQRRSDTPFQAHYPGLLTEGIGIPHHYIMRGVYADALRAVDVVLPRDPVDSRLIAVSGSGLGGTLGLAAGAFRSQGERPGGGHAHHAGRHGRVGCCGGLSSRGDQRLCQDLSRQEGGGPGKPGELQARPSLPHGWHARSFSAWGPGTWANVPLLWARSSQRPWVPSRSISTPAEARGEATGTPS